MFSLASTHKHTMPSNVCALPPSPWQHSKQGPIAMAGQWPNWTQSVLLPSPVLLGPHCAKFPNRFGRCFRLDRPVRDYAVFYVGHEGQTLTNLMLSYSQSQVCSMGTECHRIWLSGWQREMMMT